MSEALLLERGQTFQYWKQRLLALWPWELEKVYMDAHEREDPVIGEMVFHSAVYYCFQEHGYFNKRLTEEGHRTALDAAEQIARGIRNIFGNSPEQIEAFEKAYKYSVDHGKLFGWPSVAAETFEHELDRLMSADVPEAPPEIRKEYEAALGRLVLAFNAVDYLLTRTIEAAFSTLGVAPKDIGAKDFSYRLQTLELLKLSAVGRCLQAVPTDTLRQLSSDRALIVHSHMDQNPFDGTYRLINKGVDKGSSFSSDRVAGVASVALEMLSSLRQAEAALEFSSQTGSQ